MQVTSEQEQKLKQAFSLIDFDGDGKLAEEEFRALLRYAWKASFCFPFWIHTLLSRRERVHAQSSSRCLLSLWNMVHMSTGAVEVGLMN